MINTDGKSIIWWLDVCIGMQITPNYTWALSFVQPSLPKLLFVLLPMNSVHSYVILDPSMLLISPHSCNSTLTLRPDSKTATSLFSKLWHCGKINLSVFDSVHSWLSITFLSNLKFNKYIYFKDSKHLFTNLWYILAFLTAIFFL